MMRFSNRKKWDAPWEGVQMSLVSQMSQTKTEIVSCHLEEMYAYKYICIFWVVPVCSKAHFRCCRTHPPLQKGENSIPGLTSPYVVSIAVLSLEQAPKRLVLFSGNVLKHLFSWNIDRKSKKEWHKKAFLHIGFYNTIIGVGKGIDLQLVTMWLVFGLFEGARFWQGAGGSFILHFLWMGQMVPFTLFLLFIFYFLCWWGWIKAQASVTPSTCGRGVSQSCSTGIRQLKHQT